MFSFHLIILHLFLMTIALLKNNEKRHIKNSLGRVLMCLQMFWKDVSGSPESFTGIFLLFPSVWRTVHLPSLHGASVCASA